MLQDGIAIYLLSHQTDYIKKKLGIRCRNKKQRHDPFKRTSQPRRRVVGPFFEGVAVELPLAAAMGASLRLPLTFSDGAFQ